MISLVLPLLLLPLAPAQNGELKITNPRPTYGYLGAVKQLPDLIKRKGGIPGDVAHFMFDIENLKLDSKGQAQYAVTYEVFNSKNRIVYKEGPTNGIAYAHLGGKVIPCAASLEIPLEIEPGSHYLRVTVVDRATGKKAVFDHQTQVRKPDFALIRVGTFADRGCKTPTTPVCVAGESLYVGFSLVEFARDRKTKMPNVEVSLKILDEKGNPTLAEPLTGVVKADVPAELKILPLQFGLTLNRSGRYTVVLSAKDKVANKTDSLRFLLRVFETE